MLILFCAQYHIVIAFFDNYVNSAMYSYLRAFNDIAPKFVHWQSASRKVENNAAALLSYLILSNLFTAFADALCRCPLQMRLSIVANLSYEISFNSRVAPRHK